MKMTNVHKLPPQEVIEFIKWIQVMVKDAEDSDDYNYADGLSDASDKIKEMYEKD